MDKAPILMEIFLSRHVAVGMWSDLGVENTANKLQNYYFKYQTNKKEQDKFK